MQACSSADPWVAPPSSRAAALGFHLAGDALPALAPVSAPVPPSPVAEACSFSTSAAPEPQLPTLGVHLVGDARTFPVTGAAMSVEPAPPDPTLFDLDLLEDMLDLHRDNQPVTWPDGLNHRLADDVLQEAKRRRLR